MISQSTSWNIARGRPDAVQLARGTPALGLTPFAPTRLATRFGGAARQGNRGVDWPMRTDRRGQHGGDATTDQGEQGSSGRVTAKLKAAPFRFKRSVGRASPLWSRRKEQTSAVRRRSSTCSPPVVPGPGVNGCSSHSGRRGFITNAALIGTVGLAYGRAALGCIHSSLSTPAPARSACRRATATVEASRRRYA